VVSIGFTGGKESAFDVVDLIVSEKSVVGYSLHAETDGEVSKALIELGALAAKGQLKPVIDSTVSIEEFERGYSRLASRKAVGSITLHF
jgi:NADPH:quinone reductase